MNLSANTTTNSNTKSKLFTSIFSLETRNRMRAAKMGKNNPMYGKLGEDNPKWKGGSYSYYHLKAKELYGKDTCKKCKITLDEKGSDQQLDMHCWGYYQNLKKENWTCICRSCHKKLHAQINSLKF